MDMTLIMVVVDVSAASQLWKMLDLQFLLRTKDPWENEPTTKLNFSSVSFFQFFFQIVTSRKDELPAYKLVGIRFKSCLYMYSCSIAIWTYFINSGYFATRVISPCTLKRMIFHLKFLQCIFTLGDISIIICQFMCLGQHHNMVLTLVIYLNKFALFYGV